MTMDVNVVVLDFKNVKSREAVTENTDGSYTIFLNARESYEQQVKSYEHALKHIENDDFKQSDVQVIEALAHDIKPIRSNSFSIDVNKRLEFLRADKKRTQMKLLKYKRQREFLEANGVDVEALIMKQYERSLYDF